MNQEKGKKMNNLGCEYCKNISEYADDYFGNKFIHKDDYFEIYATTYNGQPILEITFDGFEEYGSINVGIDYCLKCGRKLVK